MTDKKNTLSKKNLVAEIIALNTPAFAMLKKSLGEKKLEKRLKKAVKLLTHGMQRPVEKKVVTKKAAAKKTAVKKSKKASPRKIPVASKRIAIKGK